MLGIRRLDRGAARACPPRRHQDLDLLSVDQDFAVVEGLIEVHQLDELKEKRFRHKRAFVLDDVMVELFLVERDRRGLFTSFWGLHRHDWPGDLLAWVAGLPVAGVAAVTEYRSAHATLQRARGSQTLPR